MIHERLHDLEIKITELAQYLQISRPTMYKFIESYDAGDRASVNAKVLNLFDYIVANELIDKRNVIAYILNNLTERKAVGTADDQVFVKAIRKYVADNPDGEKTKFIQRCIEKNTYDVFIHYLIEISPLLSKKKLTEDEKKLLEPYRQILSIYTNK